MSGVGLMMAVQNGAPGRSGFYADASPASVIGARSGAGSVTTTSTTVTAHGGVAPYTYAWSVSSGSTVTANSATAATTTFTGTVTSGGLTSSIMKCTVTDSTGGTPLTTDAFVSVSLHGSGVAP